MKRIPVRIKRTENNVLPLPVYKTVGASGFDLTANTEENIVLKPREIKLIPTGLIFEIPTGYELQIRPRSGLALKNGIGLVNSPGTIDSDYRGEVCIILINFSEQDFTISRGDRIAQAILCEVTRAELFEAEALEETIRGEGGFGHTGIQ
ncbi:MAG: dUTP diphosphatase [Oligoflexia bacterium]|nr:dUTP diphosphatase [Oligoflexia bacterium]